MGSDSCRGCYGCIFPRDAGKNCYMLTQYNSIHYGYLLLLLVKYVTYKTTVVIFVFVTELQSWFISCCICNWMTRQSFVLVYASYHHYMMLDEYGIHFFSMHVSVTVAIKCVHVLNWPWYWMKDFSIINKRFDLKIKLLLCVLKPRIHSLRVVKFITCNLNMSGFFFLCLRLVWW
jgi:hypothetical protein